MAYPGSFRKPYMFSQLITSQCCCYTKVKIVLDRYVASTEHNTTILIFPNDNTNIIANNNNDNKQ
jgi:hypothetical protein